jgi:hypothetical protein
MLEALAEKEKSDLQKTFIALKNILTDEKGKHKTDNLPCKDDIALARTYRPLDVHGAHGHLDVMHLGAQPKNRSMNVYQELGAVNDILDKEEHCRSKLVAAAKARLFLDTFSSSFEGRGPHILHFGGHATDDGALQFDDDLVQVEQFAEWMEHLAHSDKFRLHGIVLNACYTNKLKAKIEADLGFVVSTDSPVNGEPATRFSTAFFQVLAEGGDIVSAFHRGLLKVKQSPNCTHCKNPESKKHFCDHATCEKHTECFSRKAACEKCKKDNQQQASVYQLSIDRKILQALIAEAKHFSTCKRTTVDH